MTITQQRLETSGLLLLIFLVHLILSAWGMQSIFNAPTSYLYTNSIFLFSIMLAIHSNSSLESIVMALFIDFTLLNLEIITFTLYWPRVPWQGQYLGFAITNSALRPTTCFLLYRIFVDLDDNEIGLNGFLYNAGHYTWSISARAFSTTVSMRNSTGAGIAGLGIGSNRYRGYENMDNNAAQSFLPEHAHAHAQVQYHSNSSADEISIAREEDPRREDISIRF